MSSNHRSVPPAVLTHPSIVTLVERAAPVGSVTAEELRQAFAAAEVAPAHLKPLMAHALGMRVVAEGVESATQERYLADRHCDEVQGYLYSPGVPPGDLVARAGVCTGARRPPH